MKNREKLKSLNNSDLAYFLCIDDEGNCRGCCSICQRYYEENCDDRCVTGVNEWLENED